jgi:hypothetical protein
MALIDSGAHSENELTIRCDIKLESLEKYNVRNEPGTGRKFCIEYYNIFET